MKVLIVEDSPTVRAVLTRALESRGASVHAVQDGRAGVEASRTEAPDVILMDLQLPTLSGLEAINEIMTSAPRPIVVLSGQLGRGDVDLRFEALRAGAVDVMAKPAASGLGLEAFSDRLYRNLLLMSQVRQVTRRSSRRPRIAGLRSAAGASGVEDLSAARVLLLGASTGGPPLLASLLAAIRPPARVPIVIAQHISVGFGPGLTRWLADVGGHATVFVDSERSLLPGVVYVGAATGSPVFLSADRLGVTADLPPSAVQIHPNVDRLFESAATHLGDTVAAALLTGMGRDGAQGLVSIRRGGGATFAQDEASSTVFGMPRVAHARGAVDRLHSADALHLIFSEAFSAA